MPTLHFTQTTTSTPEQFTAAVTDFGPGREEIFGRSADGDLKVHSQSTHEADVTEGSEGIWERLHYDWSDPNRITMTTTDSNTWGGNSGHTYTFKKLPDGKTEVDVVVVRDGKTFKGKLIGLVLETVGKNALPKQFAKTVRAIEERNDPAEQS